MSTTETRSAYEGTLEAPSSTMKVPRTSSSSSAVLVNRIPDSSSSRKQQQQRGKRRHSFGSSRQLSNNGSFSSSSNGSRGGDHHRRPASPKRGRCEPMDLEDLFDKLDPNQPEHARRIFQRRKAVAKGKNTIGYQQYLLQVPKDKRMPRSMKTPSTPDPSLDIPAKRWQGLVKAWRIALHDYDPPELVGTTTATANVVDRPSTEESAAATPEGAASRVRAEELERAAALGLVVVNGDGEPVEPDPSNSFSPSSADASSSPVSVLSDATPRRCLEGDAQGTAAKKAWHWGDDSDSDDDLL